MSGKGWRKPFSRSSTKEHKEKEHSDKHGAPKNSKSSSSAKGGSGHGSKKQPSSSHDDFPAHMKPVTTSATGTTKPKVDPPPSDKDLKHAFDSLIGDSLGRRDSKGVVEYYREQYRKLKGENDTLRNKVENLSEEVESAQTRVRVKNQTIVETTDLMNEKERELNELRKAQNVTIGKTSRDHSPDDMDQLLKENEKYKQMQDQFRESYQRLKSFYCQKEEEVSRSKTQYEQLQTEFEKQGVELSKAKKGVESASGLYKFVQEQQEKLVMAERDRDTATAMMGQKDSEQKRQIELNAIMRSSHSLLIKCKENEIKKLTKVVDSKEFEITELIADKKDLEEKLARRHTRVITTSQATTFYSNQGADVLQGCSRESTHPSPKNPALTTVASETLKERDQTIERLSKEVEQLKQQVKSSDDSGVGGPCVEHTQSGGVGESPNEGNRNADASNTKRQLSKLQSTIDDLTRKLTMEQSATEDTKSQLSQSQSKVDELTRELTVERSVSDIAKNEMDKLMGQLQQLQNDKRTLEQQMNAGYKEREDRITELEEFINDQVTELDKMEAAMKQTVANKKLLEKDYQKLKEYHDTAKNLAEDYENHVIAQEDTISKLESMARQNEENASNAIATLEQEKELLIQSNQKMSREVARLMSVNVELQNQIKEVEKCQMELRKAEEELQTKEFLAGYKEREDRITELEEFINDQVTQLDKMATEIKQMTADKQLLEENYQALQVQLEKALDPLENIKELEEVEDLGEEIGRGAYGLVKKVSLHGTICAAKDIHAILVNYASEKELERIKKSFLEECVKSSKLFHPNIVQFLGIHYPSKQAQLPWLVMELLDCSLAGFVKKYDKESVSLFVKASMFCDISLGIQFLHGRNIIHRDLSSNNVLLTKHLTAKISDLGVAKLVDPSGTKSHTVAPGTQHFLPPEVISDAPKSRYGNSIDVFSLGCIMIHVTIHEWPAPLPETHYDPKLKKKVALSEIERREAYLNQIQELPELKVLIENCLHDDPGLRPNATKMVDELRKLKISYQKNSSFASNEMNAVEFEKCLKLQEKRISEKQLEIQKLNKTLQEAQKSLQGSRLICQNCNRQFRKDQVPEYS